MEKRRRGGGVERSGSGPRVLHRVSDRGMQSLEHLSSFVQRETFDERTQLLAHGLDFLSVELLLLSPGELR
jgi:hypothetical protein